MRGIITLWKCLQSAIHCVFINDPRYLKGRRTPLIVRNSNRRQSMAEFVQKMFLENRSNFKRRHLMSVRTLWNAEKQLELFVDHVSWYGFASARRAEAI